jgi:hypothetical protein
VIVWEGEYTYWDQNREKRPIASRIAFLLELVPKLITIKRNIPVEAIQDQILRHTEVLVNIRQAYRIKERLNEDSR